MSEVFSHITLHLKGGICEMWEKCTKLPLFNTKADLFRAMLKEFYANHKAEIEEANKNGTESNPQSVN